MNPAEILRQAVVEAGCTCGDELQVWVWQHWGEEPTVCVMHGDGCALVAAYHKRYARIAAASLN